MLVSAVYVNSSSGNHVSSGNLSPAHDSIKHFYLKSNSQAISFS